MIIFTCFPILCMYFKWMISINVSVVNMLLKGNGIAVLVTNVLIIVEEIIFKFFRFSHLYLTLFKEENNNFIKS